MIFKDRAVIITGASAGVGAEAARQFAQAGAKLMLVARGKKNLEAIAEELRDKTHVEIFAMDVADSEACINVVKKANFEFGRVDVLVNNAGLHARGNFLDVDSADLAAMVDVNLRGPVVLSRAALPFMIENGSGAIVNVASLAGRTPVPGAATYSATKFALRALTYALADELHDTPIKVAAVSPGPINTGFIMSEIDSVGDLTFSQPMSTAEEVAQAILDLCGNTQVEQSMPAFSGYLTTLTYLFPWLGRAVRPMLLRKGQRAKKEWKARLRAEADKAAD
ncbi:MAG: SDR family NAD(P)-dependent oxidoreductase [Woeseiaceae bacterium]|nr:SDR family NAD(P)-dependent oxidoreductase [Woeseiaceae bacterium]